MSYTPGPWHLERTTTNMGGINVAVSRVTIPDWTPLELMNESDARLIAAAPDLLEALEEIASYCIAALDTGTITKQDMTQVWETASSAIDKAKGEANA